MLKESETVEFKRQVSESLKKSIIAFANSNGGRIYLGLADDGAIMGVEQPDETALSIHNIIRDSIRPDVTQFVQINHETMEEKSVLVIEVSRGSGRPYYLTQKGIRPEGVCIRQGAASVPASENLIRQMIRETDGTTYEEMRSLVQNLTYEASIAFFHQQQAPLDERHRMILGFENKDGVQTNLGLLFSEQCPHTIKAAVFQGCNKSTFRDRRDFGGSLLHQLEETHRFLEQYNRLHAEVKGLYRVEKWDYPPEAIREVLLNCLIHRDYGLGGSTLISVFDDRVEFLTNGGLVQGISLEDVLNGLSLTRNQRLASVFYRLKLVEAYGTGLEKVMGSYSDDQNKPTFHVTANSFRIVLPNRNMGANHLDAAQRTQPVSQEMGASYAYEHKNTPQQFETKHVKWLSPEDRVCMEALRAGHMTRKYAEQILGVSQTMAGRVLRLLTEQGRLIRVGSGKRTVYLPKEPE